MLFIDSAGILWDDESHYKANSDEVVGIMVKRPMGDIYSVNRYMRLNYKKASEVFDINVKFTNP